MKSPERLLYPRFNSTGCVLEMKFDEGEGNIAYDSSGNNNHGTIYGARWVKGKYGYALEFDGVDDYVEVSYSDSLYPWKENHPCTFEVWIKPFSYPGAYGIILQYKDDEGTGRTIIAITSEGTFFTYFGGKSLTTSAIAPLNEFTHAVLRYDGTTLKFFVNGVPDAEDTRTVDEGKVGSLLIGTHKAFKWWFNGIIDEVRIYNRALSEDEIKAHYKGGRYLPKRINSPTRIISI